MQQAMYVQKRAIKIENSLQADSGSIKVIPQWFYQRFNTSKQIPFDSTTPNKTSFYSSDSPNPNNLLVVRFHLKSYHTLTQTNENNNFSHHITVSIKSTHLSQFLIHRSLDILLLLSGRRAWPSEQAFGKIYMTFKFYPHHLC